MARQELGAALGLELAGDVGRGAAEALEGAGRVDHRLAGDAQPMAHPVGIVADRQDVAERQPLGQGPTVVRPLGLVVALMEELVERSAGHAGGGDADDLGDPLGDEGQMERLVGFPDPVGAGIGDIAEPRLAVLEGLCRLAGLTHHDAAEAADHDEGENQ